MKIETTNFPAFKWIDIENPSAGELESLRKRLEIDTNFLEDAIETGHLPKIEKSKDYVFMILRAYTASQEEKIIEVGEISNKIAFFIYKDELITLHRTPFEFLAKVPKDFETVDEIILHLANEILMTYYHPIGIQSDRMDILEQNIFLKGGNSLSIESLYFEKSKARLTKKILLITQNVIMQMQVNSKYDSSFQDLKDTILDLLLKTEEIVDDSNSLLNTYMSFTAQKSNDVMKLLTVFSAFFLPLTFIAGIYGMNFDNMPELRYKYGYFIILLFMFLISIGIYLWFKRRRII